MLRKLREWFSDDLNLTFVIGGVSILLLAAVPYFVAHQ